MSQTEIDRFADLLVTLINPHTSDDDLAALVTRMPEDEARDALLALAALHSGCVEELAAQGPGVTAVLNRHRRSFRASLMNAQLNEGEGRL